MARNLDSKTVYEMMDNMLTGVAFFEVCEDKFEIMYMNDGAFRMLGYTPELGRKYINNMISLILEEDKPKFWQAVEDVLKDDGAVDVEIRTVTASGGLRWLQIRSNLYEKSKDRAVLLCVFLDATDRKFVEHEVRIQSEWYQMLLESDGEWIFEYNSITDVLVAKQAGKYGLEVKKIIDHYMQKMRASLEDMPENQRFVEIMESALRSPKKEQTEMQMSLFKYREKKWYRIHISSIAGVDGYVTHIVGKITDVHEKKLLLEELREKEKLDPLTGWLNDSETKKQVGHALLFSKDTDVHAFILVDMEQFHRIYDVLGNDVGDHVMKEVTKRIGRNFKRQDILGRISGEQFILFVQNIGTVSNLDAVVSKVSRNTEVTLGSGEDAVTVAASVGVSVYPYQGNDWYELYVKAEMAINSLKAAGRTGYHIYNLSGIYAQEISENEKQCQHYEDVEPGEDLENLLRQIIYKYRQNDNKTRAILKLIIRYYGFQQAYLSIERGKSSSGLEFRYCDNGAEEREQRKWVDFLSSMDMLDTTRIIHSYDPIPEELSSYMIRNKIYTLFIQPMLLGGHIGGVFVMGECTNKEWKLNKNEERKLKRILQLVQMYVIRYERENKGFDSLQNIHLMDDFDSYVMAVDYDTYEVTYANSKLLQSMPDFQIGDFCYRAFAHQEKPCDLCIMKRLDRNDAHAKCSEERFSTQLRSWLKMHASWAQNDENSATCVLNSMDISEYFMGGGKTLMP